MTMSHTRTAAILGAAARVVVVLSLAAALTGCGRGKVDPTKASGTVRYKKSEVTGGTITLHSDDGSVVVAEIGGDGRFSFDNVRAGTLKVTIETETVRQGHGGLKGKKGPPGGKFPGP